MTDSNAILKKAIYDKEYRARDSVAERIKQYQAKYYLENKEKKAKYFADLYKQKSEIIKARSKVDYLLNKESRSAVKSKWKKNNKSQVAFHRANRRSIQLQATPLWSNKELIKEFYVTANGLSMITGEWYHVDHIIPLVSKKVCGLHTQGNLQVIPAKDNLSKHNKVLELV
jgi:hypothetical protein